MIYFNILTNIEENDSTIEKSKFFGSPVFPKDFLETNNLNDDFFFLQLNLKEISDYETLLPKEGYIYIFLKIDTNPIVPKVFYTNQEIEEEYEDINEDFNMEDSKAKFLQFCIEETGNNLLFEETEYISLITLDMEKVPTGFPNFNQTKGKIKVLIKKIDLQNLDFTNALFCQEA